MNKADYDEDMKHLLDANSSLLAREKELLNVICALRESYEGICIMANVEPMEYRPYREAQGYQPVE
jgi:hypothetical protein